MIEIDHRSVYRWRVGKADNEGGARTGAANAQALMMLPKVELIGAETALQMPPRNFVSARETICDPHSTGLLSEEALFKERKHVVRFGCLLKCRRRDRR